MTFPMRRVEPKEDGEDKVIRSIGPKQREEASPAHGLDRGEI